MIKVFISQPMRDKTDEEIKAERKRITEQLRFIYLGQDVEIIDSFFECAPYDAKPLWFIGKSIQLLANADLAYFAKGWQDNRGCRIEHICAKEYGVDITEE